MTHTTPTTPDNITRLHARIDSLALTYDQRRSLLDHLLGGVSGHVSPTDWDEAVERAVRFAAPLAPVEVSS